MEKLITILGFTSLTNSIWNFAAYAAFIAIIIGVFSEKHRNIFFTLGAATLAIYAGIFLHNQLLTALQALIVISGILQWTGVSKRSTVIIMIALTITTYVFLVAIGAIVDVWALIGSFGLLGIAFGLAMLPKHYGFIVMAVGGILLVIYAFVTSVRVFFLLNIFFAVANLWTWQKVRSVNPTK